MAATRGVTACQECFLKRSGANELRIVPRSENGEFLLRADAIVAYRQTLHQRPSFVSRRPPFVLNVTVCRSVNTSRRSCVVSVLVLRRVGNSARCCSFKPSSWRIESWWAAFLHRIAQLTCLSITWTSSASAASSILPCSPSSASLSWGSSTISGSSSSNKPSLTSISSASCSSRRGRLRAGGALSDFSETSESLLSTARFSLPLSFLVRAESRPASTFHYPS